MDQQDYLDKLANLVIEFDDENITEACNDVLAAGIDPNTAILQGLAKGMQEVGVLYDQQEYGIPEVLLCADVLNMGMEILQKDIKKGEGSSLGRIVIGTVEGDIHSIGKNIVKLMLDVAGFQVIDLGEDVPSEDIISELNNGGADIVALSTMMTTSLGSMETIIKDVRAEFPDMKFLIGGASVTETAVKQFGAHGYAKNATEAVKVVRSMTL